MKTGDQFVLHAVNSFVGKPGNIGYRAGFILKALTKAGIPFAAIARGGTAESRGLTTMGVVGHLPRLLNAYRIYVHRGFDFRKYDALLFECFTRVHLPRIDRRAKTAGKKVLHLWELSPKIIRAAKERDYLVVLEMPIAPSLYARQLHETGLLPQSLRELDRLEPIERECFERSDAMVCPSSFVDEVVSRYGVPSSKRHVIPFGAIKSEQPRAQLHPDKEGVDFVFAGTINSRKGIDQLVEAFDHPSFKKDRLHLCGRIFPEQAALLRSKSLPNIILPGFVDTRSYFRECDIYVFPSLMEGSSKSTYEAMAAGMPLITTPSSGSICRDGKDGLIVPAGSVGHLREAMLKLKNDKNMRISMARSALERTRKFTWESYSAQLLELYTKVQKAETAAHTVAIHA